MKGFQKEIVSFLTILENYFDAMTWLQGNYLSNLRKYLVKYETQKCILILPLYHSLYLKVSLHEEKLMYIQLYIKILTVMFWVGQQRIIDVVIYPRVKNVSFWQFRIHFQNLVLWTKTLQVNLAVNYLFMIRLEKCQNGDAN